MKMARIISGIFLALAAVSCSQFSQRIVSPIPPPAPETLERPIPEHLKDYYTLSEPTH